MWAKAERRKPRARRLQAEVHPARLQDLRYGIRVLAKRRVCTPGMLRINVILLSIFGVLSDQRPCSLPTI